MSAVTSVRYVRNPGVHAVLNALHLCAGVAQVGDVAQRGSQINGHERTYASKYVNIMSNVHARITKRVTPIGTRSHSTHTHTPVAVAGAVGQLG